MLTIKNLTIKTQQTVLYQKFNLTINIGEFWAVLGKNGAGKTTLFNTIIKKDFSLSQVYFNELDLALKTPYLQTKISFLPQSHSLYLPFTVEEYLYNIQIAPHTYFYFLQTEDILVLNKIVDLFDLSSIKNHELSTLSIGQQQRVMLAATIIQNPQLYILDEPNNNLDLHYTKIFFDFLKLETQNKKIAVMASMHDLNLSLKYCTHFLLLLEDGIWQSRTKAELLEENLLQKLFGEELKILQVNNEILTYLI